MIGHGHLAVYTLADKSIVVKEALQGAHPIAHKAQLHIAPLAQGVTHGIPVGYVYAPDVGDTPINDCHLTVVAAMTHKRVTEQLHATMFQELAQFTA
jgi:hypothetical protein